jgi:magnesium-transporting ATPase (P-type)
LIEMRWKLIGITLGIAAASTLVRIVLNDMSRPSERPRRNSLTRDDFVFWVDWAILGSLSFMVSVIGASNAHKLDEKFGPSALAGCLALFVVASIFTPWVLQNFAYDESGKIRGWWALVAVDLWGALLLAAAVQLGITVYDWTGTGA